MRNSVIFINFEQKLARLLPKKLRESLDVDMLIEANCSMDLSAVLIDL